MTPEEIAKKLSALVRKRVAQKKLNRSEVLLEAALTEEGVCVLGILGTGYAKTWDELADALSVDRRTLTNLREQFPDKCPKDRADGRKPIARWMDFLREMNVRGRGVNNPASIDEKALKLEERQLRVERERHELNKAIDSVLPIAQFESALGHMLAKFRAALDALPQRIAGGIDEADAAELVKLLARAEADGLTISQLMEKAAAGGFKFADYHARRAFVETEVQIVKRSLVKCDYLKSIDSDGDQRDS